MDREKLQAGTSLSNGVYRIESIIGSGGFGITYFVRNMQFGNVFAVKEFFITGSCIRDTQSHRVVPQSIDDESYNRYLDSFIKEAQTLLRLDHPNIVKVNDVFRENNTAYIVMPYIEGNTLQKAVESTGRLGYEKAVNYIAQISEAVAYIHKQKILHRDIKPENIIITLEDIATLIDFGSAREFVQDRTQRHTALLTPGYAPLEQYSAISRKGYYTDIYALGATFYFTLTGQMPTDAASRSAGEPMPEPKALIPSIPDEANDTILKAMQLRPENRYQRVDELMEDLLNKEDEEDVKKQDAVTDSSGGKIGKFLRYALPAAAIISWLIFLLVKQDWMLDQGPWKTLETTKTGTEIIPPPKSLTEDEIRQLNKFKNRAKELYNFAVTTDPDYYEYALQQCNKALSIKPDEKEMLDLKQSIEKKKKNSDY
jgi:serine/threonine-protein kinase